MVLIGRLINTETDGYNGHILDNNFKHQTITLKNHRQKLSLT